MHKDMLMIDGLQYVNWNRQLFEDAQQGGVHCIHVTIVYWENIRETLENIGTWNRHFINHGDLIMPVRQARDILEAKRLGKVGIVFGFQNCSPIEDDVKMVEILHQLGVRIMQLTYNNQSLLATGCYEEKDGGVTRFGKQVIKEMNRVGMVIDMSHSAEKSTLETIELSQRPIAITHANPSFFHTALRNKSDTVIRAIGESEGMLGFSMYPFHLKNGPDCTLEEFCQMIGQTVEMIGIDRVGIGSDLCLNWDYKVLEWMRSGRWTTGVDHGEGSAERPAWPDQPSWFGGTKDLKIVAQGLEDQGFSDDDIAKVMGKNWLSFFEKSFSGSLLNS
ncbi:MAG: membrane dipeptidase [Porticoccaceae bacterium]|nr:membrane dipeptidase [Porticoccaceae bacterium]MBT7167367.1 membrane dipeptidase [Porticoccaceae bacterium]MBT7964386.1 membrane dipeptidase [Porticoccaceae bacterium]